MSWFTANDWDHRIIDATSAALGGIVGQQDDIQRLLTKVNPTEPKEREKTLAEIAIAYIRYCQDLKKRLDIAKSVLEKGGGY